MNEGHNEEIRVSKSSDTCPFKKDHLPQHVAIIMDGNGRWAKARGLPRIAGHKQGVEAVRRTLHTVGKWGIPNLTFFGFSSENWSRPEEEVSGLISLIKRFVHQNLTELHEANVRVRVIGDDFRLDDDILKILDQSTRLTKDNTGLNLTIAFNYGARAEITRAAARLADQVADGTLAASDITEDTLAGCLDTADLPDPDLLIRTSGEKRLSNFLLWQCAYTEFVFLDVLWPDFGPEHMSIAIEDYLSRDRRFGGLTAQPAV